MNFNHHSVTGRNAVFPQDRVSEAMKNEANRQEYTATNKAFDEDWKKSVPADQWQWGLLVEETWLQFGTSEDMQLCKDENIA